MNDAISGEILAKESRFPRSEIFFATLVGVPNFLKHAGIILEHSLIGCSKQMMLNKVSDLRHSAFLRVQFSYHYFS